MEEIKKVYNNLEREGQVLMKKVETSINDGIQKTREMLRKALRW